MKTYKITFLISIVGLLAIPASYADPSRRYATSFYENASSSTISQQIVRHTKNQIGIPYRYGGTSPSRGFDCSGLVHYTHKLAGLTVPRNSVALLRTVKPIAIEHLQPGDLVFFLISKNQVTHVGIYIDNGKFVHAPKPGKRVKTENLNSRYWKNRIVSVGRLY